MVTYSLKYKIQTIMGDCVNKISYLKAEKKRIWSGKCMKNAKAAYSTIS